MNKSFADVLILSEDEFAKYFNSLVADDLGRGGAGAGAGAASGRGGSLSLAEQSLIQETRDDLYKKLERAKAIPQLVSEGQYFALEAAHILHAKTILQNDLSTPATEAKADATAGASASASSPSGPPAERAEVGAGTAAGGAGAGATTAASASNIPSLASLSHDPLNHIVSYLPLREIGRLASVSKVLHTELKSWKFLFHVARGQQDEAEAMLKKDRSLLTISGELTDYSGRRFICTACEYAYWAKDTHMWRMLQRYMNDEAKAILRKRIDVMEGIDPTTGQARGLVYWQRGVKKRSAHFDFSPLIEALQQYVSGYARWRLADQWNLVVKQWRNVAAAQRDVPAHVAQEYCRLDRSFYPTPDFAAEESLPRATIWFFMPRSDADADATAACVREGRFEGVHFPLLYPETMMPHMWLVPPHDLLAVRRLDEVRTADLVELRAYLNPPSAALAPASASAALASAPEPGSAPGLGR